MKQVSMKATGLNIKQMCIAKGLTPKDLSEKFNVTLTTPYLWFNGEMLPRTDTLMNLCELLGCKVEDILVMEEVEDGQ